MKATAKEEEKVSREVWLEGAVKVNECVRRTGLNRGELFDLMREGVLVWVAKDAKKTRLIAWASVVDYLASLYESREDAP